MAHTLLFLADEHDSLVRRVGMLARDRILVVDDNESIRTILAESLAYQGFRVSTAADGKMKAELLGAFTVLSKPFGVDQIAHTLRRALAK